jgi:hypothetical protein
MRTHTIKTWDKKAKIRGKRLHWLQKRVDKLSEDLHFMQLNHPHRATTRHYWEQYCKALNIAVAKDMAMRKEAMETKWIQMAGKPNKDFLAKPKSMRKRIGNMTIDNVKDEPDLSRTNDINIILQNFVDYYAKLYEHKGVCPLALDRLIANLMLNLNEEDVEMLEAPIKKGKMLKALVDTPKGKSLGTNRLPYECYKECPNEATQILASIGNKVVNTGTQPTSWAQIVISVLPKEQDSYQPISSAPSPSLTRTTKWL